jgi:lipoate---protein ligase
MLYVLSNSLNPYYNLSAEEYLLKHNSDEIFMLWRSEPAVIIGKHQNALAEINYKYIRENNIKVARRLSGGGTVVHDLQNLNFTFIANGEEGKLIDFKRFVDPIIDFLATLGIESQMGKTNDIRIGNLKISGNAEHVYRKRVLHHGTLLFNSDLNQLRKAINVSLGKYIDKAVQSNRAHVTNIVDHLQKRISIEEFTNRLINFIAEKDKIQLYNFSENEKSAISKLVKEKYDTRNWIWGYSPKYTFRNNFSALRKDWSVELVVKNGIIQESEIIIKEENRTDYNSLQGVWHKFKNLEASIKNLYNFDENTESEIEVFINYFF